MKKHERTYIHFLEDILLSMERIQEYISTKEFITFKKDYKTVDAVIRNFEVIGEAAKNLPAEIKEKYSHLPWEEMYRLRNRITHGYFGIDYQIIWDIVTNELPENYRDLKKIIREEKITNYLSTLTGGPPKG